MKHYVKKTLVYVTCFLFMTSMLSCATEPTRSDILIDYFTKSKQIEQFRHFYKEMTTSEQVEKFKHFPLDDQYDIYIFGNQVVHPPALYLADPIAEQGSAAVPFLKKKLNDTQEESTIRDIIYIFAIMADLNSYDFSDDPELMSIINNKASQMNGIWKEYTIKDVYEIEEQDKIKKAE